MEKEVAIKFANVFLYEPHIDQIILLTDILSVLGLLESPSLILDVPFKM